MLAQTNANKYREGACMGLVSCPTLVAASMRGTGNLARNLAQVCVCVHISVYRLMDD